jgi:hypothetical protein
VCRILSGVEVRAVHADEAVCPDPDYPSLPGLTKPHGGLQWTVCMAVIADDIWAS